MLVFFSLYKAIKIILKWPKEMMNKTLVKDGTSEFQKYWLFIILHILILEYVFKYRYTN